MRKLTVLSLLFILFSHVLPAQDKEVKLKFIETSDIHGNFFPYNFITKKPEPGSLARIYSLIETRREEYGNNLILIDNGDILQGQPTPYYYNYIDTTSTHLCADMLNYMGYSVGNIGNHDVEVGRPAMERWIKDCQFPILGANIIDKSTGEPFLKPYEVIEREGIKVAILGMVTPAIPFWLPESLWEGLYFDDMEKTARRWINIIKKKEKPDVIIGLFHSGQYESLLGKKYKDNASISVAQRVKGFDILMIGHDHIRECKKIIGNAGDTMLVVNPADNGRIAAEVNITLKLREGKVYEKSISGELTSIEQYNPSPAFMDHFSPQFDSIQAFVNKKIGVFDKALTTRESYFGPSPFVDFVHAMQLKITGADVSFASPLAFDVEIKKGDVLVSDLFALYRFENQLYTMRLSGREIKKHLEMSYDMWTDRMKSPSDHMLKFKDKKKKDWHFNALKYFSFNFDSAAGIIYTVDLTKKKGHKVNIISMADGSPFNLDKEYKVVVNSYRGNGGGELLTKGAGIPHDKLKERIINVTDKDFRYYLIRELERHDTLAPKALNHWKFIPEEWVETAAKEDYNILFNKTK
ncbi:bifunctional UDP-sugar hydrolase/5'-nucleotidase [Bacteroides sp. 51]|uniref:bifunctional metallophosphatase/5'-nucleotidase n=1 Tax=Bacteroides sp. 51 TaxID=2302938 RepID=UPI0013D3B837|nr:bifunctional metallophosphatase/5'-nucleotidase [Bacteroides sp. 51]NDV83720.1 bifunctional metallophosphatase/5'-nucleotidase [Bacteroides sp. 51]